MLQFVRPHHGLTERFGLICSMLREGKDKLKTSGIVAGDCANHKICSFQPIFVHLPSSNVRIHERILLPQVFGWIPSMSLYL